MKVIATFAFALFAFGIFAADIPKAPVPPSPYLPIIYKYADAMLERGRDTNGLFHSVLNRVTMVPLALRTSGPTPQDHQNLLRLLYTLSELSAKPKYRTAADAELRWFLSNADSRIYLSNQPWMLWDRCFEIAPEAALRLAVRLTNERLDSKDVEVFYRQAGFYLRAWAQAYAHTREESFLKASEALFDQTEKVRQLGKNAAFASTLSLSIDCDAASRLVPGTLASRLRAFADHEDKMFCPLPEWLKSTGAFVTGDGRRVPPWMTGSGDNTTARIGLMCVSRYENTGGPAYRDLVHAAADLYLDSLPASDADVWPMTFGHAISLQVAAWRSTAQQKYLDRGRELADFAVKHFFDQGPLPRASLKSNHYDATTGADTLALGFVELHLHILAITAVRYPPNTIDR